MSCSKSCMFKSICSNINRSVGFTGHWPLGQQWQLRYCCEEWSEWSQAWVSVSGYGGQRCWPSSLDKPWQSRSTCEQSVTSRHQPSPGVTMSSPGRHHVVTSLQPSVVTLSPSCNQLVTRSSPGHHQLVTRSSPGRHKVATKLSLSCH
jgi:hypothetical protein